MITGSGLKLNLRDQNFKFFEKKNGAFLEQSADPVSLKIQFAKSMLKLKEILHRK